MLTEIQQHPPILCCIIGEVEKLLLSNLSMHKQKASLKVKQDVEVSSGA
jgi:hypothetical protein